MFYYTTVFVISAVKQFCQDTCNFFSFSGWSLSWEVLSYEFS